jgi:hypothetical protein
MSRVAIPTRLEARKVGAPRYQGAPCTQGHTGERFTRSGACVVCQAMGQRRRRGTPVMDPIQFEELLG